MKKLIYILLAAAATFTACKKDESAKINDVTVQVLIGDEPVTDAVEVTVTDKSTSTAYKATTVGGTATFRLVAGIYEASATFYKESSIYNGTNSAVTVVDGGANSFTLNLTASTTSQIIIKELYVGGCMDNEGAKDYALDKYVILYNNSPLEADASKMAFGIGSPANSNSINYYLKDGNLTYSDYIPAWNAVWWFQKEVKIAPYSQIVISITGAINHTETYSKSVDLSKADYVFYDPEVFNNVSNYPAPSASIPSDNYLKTYCYGLGTAWAISKTSPAFFIFSPEGGMTAKAFVTNPDNIESPTGKQAFNCAKIPLGWIKDGVEVYDYANIQKSHKRLLDSVDAGYVTFTNKSGTPSTGMLTRRPPRLLPRTKASWSITMPVARMILRVARPILPESTPRHPSPREPTSSIRTPTTPGTTSTKGRSPQSRNKYGFKNPVVYRIVHPLRFSGLVPDRRVEG